MLYRSAAALFLVMGSLSAAAPADQSYKSVIITGGDVVPAENEHIRARAAAYKSVIITGGDVVPPEEEK